MTPPAILDGRLLAYRLLKAHNETVDWRYVCTTVFAPLEYGSMGMTEETAKEQNLDCSI